MSTMITDGNGQRVAASDLLSVGTRISWGAVLAGAAVALSTLILLGVLATAAGVTLRDRMSDQGYFVGAMICSIVMTLAALFLGGFVVSRLTAGEDKTEAVTYGIVLWGTLFVALAALTAAGANIGYHALGMRQEAQALPESLFQGMQTPLTQQQVGELQTRYRNGAPDVNPTTAAWWTFITILLSLGASVGGSIAGAGPTLFLRQMRERYPRARVTTTGATQSQMQTSNR